MARRELSVQPREVTGKKVAFLRREGVLPANLYGRGVASVSLQLSTEELEHTVRTIAANEVIDLKIAGERVSRPVVIHKIQRSPLNSEFLHADFYQVSLREKMRAEVPVLLVGESAAVATFNGVLMTTTEIIHIEALPLDIPAHIEVDISSLKELESTIHVRDLVIPGNVTVLSDPDISVVKVAAPRVTGDEEELPTAAAGAETTAEAEEEPAAEATADGEEKAAE